ncbi:hypothetical protein D3C83_293660 [compost metagenome]
MTSTDDEPTAQADDIADIRGQLCQQSRVHPHFAFGRRADDFFDRTVERAR